ncbi:FecR family protein [Desertivirga arenae]|uniref:FecR family protein n=1 Tax=Desertivirga arenae TaxID=2810309 RepID=UPI001A96AC57|nr:FecR family protein [Pedobacter sp. SYSU D00823]
MNEDIKTTLVKYITGQADETESAEVREWIKSSSENQELYFQLYEAWHQSLEAQGSIDVDAAYASFAEKNIARRTLIKRLYKALRVAAAIILLPLSIGAFYKVFSNPPEVSFKVVKVPKGTPRKLKLPDGTLVWLNAGTELKYSEDFGKDNRTVYLVGEAYFDIAKSDANLPFLVKTDKFTIRDVGTVFNVKAYPDEEIFETAVVEGKVSVEGPITENSSQNSKVFLDAHQLLKITKVATNSGTHEVASVNDEVEPVKVEQIEPGAMNEFNGWRSDLLIFQEDSFEDIARILERRYNVTIQFESEGLKNYKYTGAFKNLDNISKVLQVIKETTPIKYTVQNQQITISEN